MFGRHPAQLQIAGALRAPPAQAPQILTPLAKMIYSSTRIHRGPLAHRLPVADGLNENGRRTGKSPVHVRDTVVKCSRAAKSAGKRLPKCIFRLGTHPAQFHVVGVIGVLPDHVPQILTRTVKLR